MTASLEQALLSFMRALRWRRHAPVVLALLGAVIVAQSALVVHRIDHASPAHGVSCALCQAADHHAATFEEPFALVVPVEPEPVVARVAEPTNPAFTTFYRARAPPRDLRIRRL